MKKNPGRKERRALIRKNRHEGGRTAASMAVTSVEDAAWSAAIM